MFPKKESTQTLWVGLSFLVVGLAIGLLVNGGTMPLGGSENNQAPDPTQGFDPSELEVVSVSEDDDPFIGDADAPITIIEFSDYQCSYCKGFSRDSLPQIIENYVDEGVVKVVFRDYPLPPEKHPQAILAAEAAECVRAYTTEEDADSVYFKMHDFLFENTALWSGQSNAEEVMVSFAKEDLGVEIQSCLDNGEMTEEVQADYVAGKSYGVTGTPTFFINGKKLVGGWPYSVFEGVIESLK